MTTTVTLGSTSLMGRVRPATYTAVAADATADYAVVDVSDMGAIDGAMVQVFRAGVDVTADAVVTLNNSGTGAANGYIRVADGAATYAVTADDVITVIAFAAEV